MKLNFYAFIALFLMAGTSTTFAGNPDRQGESGAYELILTPWTRTAGLQGLNCSDIKGVEAMRVNPAGISRIHNLEVAIGSAQYLRNSGTHLNGLGVSTKVGKNKNGAIGISLMSMSFGDIPVTTEDQPDGTGSTFSPSFFNIGIAYGYTFENKISVGFLMRVISESIADISALGVGFDFGVQYVSGDQDNFKLGISLRNVGTPMSYSGEGFTLNVDPDGNTDRLSLRTTPAEFELPTQLNIGISYDFYLGYDAHIITPMLAFTGNSFFRDQIGVGLEYSYKKILQIRGSYEGEIGSDSNISVNNVYTGLGVGASLYVPLSKKNDSKMAIEYAFRTTEIFNGTHNFGIKFML